MEAAKTVWKYNLKLSDYQTIEMPEGAEFLRANIQHDSPVLWALVNPDKPMKTYGFRLAGTGHTIQESGLEYIDSIMLDRGRFVFHLFHQP